MNIRYEVDGETVEPFEFIRHVQLDVELLGNAFTHYRREPSGDWTVLLLNPEDIDLVSKNREQVR